MKILAIDTATESCSVALCNNNHIECKLEITMRDHAERILVWIAQLLKKQGLRLADLQAIAFDRGPGTFIGLRVGVGIAQGLGLGSNLPLISLSSLVIMAEDAFHQTTATRVLAAMNAFMGEIYWAEYQRDNFGLWHGVQTETLIIPEAAQKRLLTLEGSWAMVGTAWKVYPKLLSMASEMPIRLVPTEVSLPSAKNMLPLALNALQRKEILKPESIHPIYFRKKIAKKLRDP